MNNPWVKHKRKGIVELRDYVPGEDLEGICVNGQDVPAMGGKIARNLNNHADQWYMSKEYYEALYEALDK